MIRRRLLAILLAVVVAHYCAVIPGVALADGWGVVNATLVSVAPDGAPANAMSRGGRMTPDGRFVTFWSPATNLVPGLVIPPHNGYPVAHAYVYDRVTRSAELVSRSSSGSVADAGSRPVMGISDDGRYVVFESTATNLIDADPIPPDGRTSLVYLRDRHAGTTVRLGSGHAMVFLHPHAMSGDGSLVVLSGMDENGNASAEIYDQRTGFTTELPDGATAATISPSGRYVAYTISEDSGDPGRNTVHRLDMATGETMPILVGTTSMGVVLSRDGSQAAYYTAGDVSYDLYVHDIDTGQTTLVYAGTYAATISGLTTSTDGRHLGFYIQTIIDNHTVGQIWVADLLTGRNHLIDSGAAKQVDTHLSADGTQIVFTSATRLTGESGQDHVFVAQLGPLAPVAPDGLSAESPTRTSPLLAWEPVVGAVRYHVYRDESLAGSCVEPEFTDTTAAAGSHDYHVRAVSHGDLVSGPSAVVSVMYDPDAPSTIRPSMSQTVVIRRATVNVGAAASDSLSGVAGGEYYIDVDPGRGHGAPLAYVDGQLYGSATIGGLRPGFHRLYIRATDEAGNWSPSVPVVFLYL